MRRKQKEEAGQENERKRDKAAAGERKSTNYTNDDNMCTKVDPESLFNCSTCNKILLSAIFRCTNRHVVCSECAIKVNNMKCSVCRLSLDNYSGQEVIIESINVSCPYSALGCKEAIISYAELDTHRESCIFAPCSCPMPKCTFRSPASQFSAHISSRHSTAYESCPQSSDSSICMKFWLRRDDPIRILQTKGGPLFLLLNSRDNPLGNSMSLISFGQGTKEPICYKYQLKVWFTRIKAKRCLTLEAPVEHIRDWKEDDKLTGTFLFLPEYFFVNPFVTVDVHIEKISDY